MIKPIYQKYQREIWVFILIFAFLAPYFLINYLTLGRSTHNLTLNLDQIIPFLPEFIFVYVSSYLIVFMPYFLIKDDHHFRHTANTFLIALSLGYLVFLIYPVKMIRPEIITTGFFSDLMRWFYGLDCPYNCFPSLHVAMSFLSAAACYRYTRKYWSLFLWAALIAVSTLLVKQHYFLDVIGGLILFLIVYWLILKNDFKS